MCLKKIHTHTYDQWTMEVSYNRSDINLIWLIEQKGKYSSPSIAPTLVFEHLLVYVIISWVKALQRVYVDDKMFVLSIIHVFEKKNYIWVYVVHVWDDAFDSKNTTLRKTLIKMPLHY